MSTGAHFFFATDLSKVGGPADFVIQVPPGLNDSKELLAALAEKLGGPDDVSHSWSTLEACLSDLSWIEQRRVLLLHEDLPLNPNPRSQAAYVAVLSDCTEHWKSGGDHQLVVAFPADQTTKVEALLRDEDD